MDRAGTVFYLVPLENNKYAQNVVDNAANRDRRCANPYNPTKLCLRISLDQPAKITPYHLARFGRLEESCDVLLGCRFPRSDQCWFEINRENGELLLRDLSQEKNTELFGKQDGRSAIWKEPRHCVVELNREWIFKIHLAEFHLIPRRTRCVQDEAAFTKERLAFARQPDPGQTGEWDTEVAEQFSTLSLQPNTLTNASAPRSTPTVNNFYTTPSGTQYQPREKLAIECKKLRWLGSGAQGEVYEVVDEKSGIHYARKVLSFKNQSVLGKDPESAFRKHIMEEVALVKRVAHENIIPYIHAQERTGQRFEIFMPVYEGNLYQLMIKMRHNISAAKTAKLVEAAKMAETCKRMFRQILGALDFLHTEDPPILHRDVKPVNILYQGQKFLLADFGIAKAVSPSRNFIGTRRYMAPELCENSDQTPKIDIYALGATFVDCYVTERAKSRDWRERHQELQSHLRQLVPPLAPMLANAADQRPTARQLLRVRISSAQLIQASLPHLESNTRLQKSPPATEKANATTMFHPTAHSPMDWTADKAISQRIHQPTQQNRSTQFQPATVPEEAPTPDDQFKQLKRAPDESEDTTIQPPRKRHGYNTRRAKKIGGSGVQG